MDTNFEQLKQQIVDALKKKAPNLKCPACQSSEFIFVDGFFANDLQADLSRRQMGGMNIPTVPIVCKNCGYIMEFAVGSLGLLPKPENKQE